VHAGAGGPAPGRPRMSASWCVTRPSSQASRR
jgi:hypothetical protein